MDHYTGDRMKPSAYLQAKRVADEFRARMEGVNYRCECGALHALFYRVGKGDKRTLSYTCDHQKRYWYVEDKAVEGGIRECWKYITQTMDAPVNLKGLAIPEVWTPQRKAEDQKRNQLQMAIPTTRK